MKIINIIVFVLSTLLCLAWPIFFVFIAFFDNPESEEAIEAAVDKFFILQTYPWGYVLGLIWLSMIYGKDMWESRALTILFSLPFIHILLVALIL